MHEFYKLINYKHICDFILKFNDVRYGWFSLNMEIISSVIDLRLRNLSQYSYGFKIKVYSIHHYVIKFVSDLRQVRGFFRMLKFSPPIKLTTTI